MRLRIRWPRRLGPDPSGPVRIVPARRRDLQGIARVFSLAFEDTLRSIFGRMPPRRVFRDVFSLCYRAEPSGLLVARSGLGVAGYVFAPSDMGRLYRAATLGGHLWQWLRHWLRGDYGFGWSPLRVLLLDKYAFLRSSLETGPFPAARILSIAVDPAFRGRGLGSALLQAALASLAKRGARRVRLEVRPENAAAVRMYEKAGFRRVGTMVDTRGPWWIMEAEVWPGGS